MKKMSEKQEWFVRWILSELLSFAERNKNRQMADDIKKLQDILEKTAFYRKPIDSRDIA